MIVLRNAFALLRGPATPGLAGRLVLLGFLCFGASTSRAEGMLPGGAMIKFDQLLIHEDKASPTPTQPSTEEVQDAYFNMAHCVCSQFDYENQLPEFYGGLYGYRLTIEGGDTTPIELPIEIWTGAACNVDQQTRDAQCHKASVSAGTVAQIQTAGERIIEIPLFDLFEPVSPRMGCQERDAQMGTTWALVDSEPDGTLDYSASAVVVTDTKAPALPVNFRAVGAENAIKLEWDAPPGGTTDVAYFQALCATTLGGGPAKTDPPAPRYLTARQLCDASSDAFLMPSDISSNTGTDAGVGSIVLNDDMAQLNPLFICGEATPTAVDMRINGLKNGTEYTVIFLAIDKAGNAAGTYFTSSLVPVPATDFWEDLQDQGSGVEGGFCLLSQTYGDSGPLTQALRAFRDDTLARTAYGRWLIDVYYGTVGSLDLHGSLALRIIVGVLLLPFVVLALLWHALTLPGLIALIALLVLARKRILRARRLVLAATTFAMFVLVPARAQAQVPYWEENEFANPEAQELAPGDPMRVNWHAGIRLGPYVPGIDAQLDMPVGTYDGPYEQMFGGYSIMPVLDVERFFLHHPGQLGVGFSIGYMGKKARAWQAGTMPTDPSRPRAEGDENKFRMIPMALSGVFRLTYFDDNFGVPLIPYARAGLAYYVWWVTAPNGDFAKACVDGGMTDGCTQTKARGASLGFVGSIGLALRAERVDESAARSMRESGIEHAGFYAEYSLGKVDGFGSDTKLSVGDATWFAGVDFEF